MPVNREKQLIGLALVPGLLLVLAGCARSPQAAAAKHLGAAKMLMQKHDYSRALLEVKSAIQVTPKSAEAYYQLGLAYSGSNDPGKAVSSYRKALELDPHHPKAQLQLAQLMAVLGDKTIVEEAGVRLKKLLEDLDDLPDTLNTLAFTELRLGHASEAIKYLSWATGKFPRELSSALLFAQVKLQSGDVVGAEEILKNLVGNSPQSSEARALLGAFYQSQRRMADAEQILRQALAIKGDSGLVLMQMASLYSSQGKTADAEQIYKRLSVYSEKEYQPLYALFLFQSERKAEALQEFERLYKKDPQDRLTRTRLVAVYNGLNRKTEAEKVLAEALKKNPKDLEALIQRGEVFLEEQQFARAEADFNEVQHLQPASPAIHYLQAKLNQARGNPRIYRQELAEALRLNAGFLAVRMELAQSLLQSKDPKAALDLLNQAPESQKQLPSFIEQRNWALWSLGDIPAMQKGIEQGLSRQRTPELLVQEGLYKLRTGDPKNALKSLQESLQIDPSDLLALRALNQSYHALKEGPLAIAKVKEYAALRPKSPEVEEFLGELLSANGDMAGARAAFTAAKAASPWFIQATLSLVRLDLVEGKWDIAQKRLEETVKSGESGTIIPLLWLAVIEEVRGDKANAMQNYRKVVETSPNEAQALNNLADLTAENPQSLDEALKYAQKAVELDPTKPSYADTLGWILYRKGLYSLAIPYLERAGASPRSTVGKYHLAMAYAKTGDKRGRVVLDAALRQNARLPEAKIAQEVVGQN